MARRLAASVLFHSLLWQVTLSSSNSYSYGKQEMLFSEYIRSIQDSREQIIVPFRCGRELRVAFCFTWTGRLNPNGALQLPTSRMRWRVARTTHTICSVTLTTPSTPTSSISDLFCFSPPSSALTSLSLLSRQHTRLFCARSARCSTVRHLSTGRASGRLFSFMQQVPRATIRTAPYPEGPRDSAKFRCRRPPQRSHATLPWCWYVSSVGRIFRHTRHVGARLHRGATRQQGVVCVQGRCEA